MLLFVSAKITFDDKTRTDLVVEKKGKKLNPEWSYILAARWLKRRPLPAMYTKPIRNNILCSHRSPSRKGLSLASLSRKSFVLNFSFPPLIFYRLRLDPGGLIPESAESKTETVNVITNEYYTRAKYYIIVKAPARAYGCVQPKITEGTAYNNNMLLNKLTHNIQKS